MDQSKLNVIGQRRSQKLNAGRYKKVSVLVKKLLEFAAGLSELEKSGGLFPIKTKRKERRQIAVTIRDKIRGTNPIEMAWKTKGKRMLNNISEVSSEGVHEGRLIAHKNIYTNALCSKRNICWRCVSSILCSRSKFKKAQQ